MAQEDDDKFIESFRRDSSEPAPKWAFQSDKILEEMEKVPLFMTALPNEPNAHLDALQALLYDGTPEEIATNFKNNGNESMQRGDLQGCRDAIIHYTKGLEVNPDSSELKASLFTNRALANLKLQNYGSTRKDALQALSLDPAKLKARYYLAKALVLLERYEEAQEHISQLPNEERHRLEEIASTQRKKRVEDPRMLALRARNLEHCPGIERPILAQLQGMHECPIFHFLDDSDSTSPSKLVFPVVLFYPSFGQFDLIEKFPEDDRIVDQLSEVLCEPAPWDPAHTMRVGKVSIFFVDQSDPRVLHKIDCHRTLKSYFGSVITKVDFGLISFIVVPHSEAAPFVAKFDKVLN